MRRKVAPSPAGSPAPFFFLLVTQDANTWAVKRRAALQNGIDVCASFFASCRSSSRAARFGPAMQPRVRFELSILAERFFMTLNTTRRTCLLMQDRGGCNWEIASIRRAGTFPSFAEYGRFCVRERCRSPSAHTQPNPKSKLNLILPRGSRNLVNGYADAGKRGCSRHRRRCWAGGFAASQPHFIRVHLAAAARPRTEPFRRQQCRQGCAES